MVSDVLGSQGAVCSGGRYDDLIEKIGGKSTHFKILLIGYNLCQ